MKASENGNLTKWLTVGSAAHDKQWNENPLATDCLDIAKANL